MGSETGKWSAAVVGAAEAAALLVLFFVAGPVVLALLDALRLAVSGRNSPNVID